MSQLTNLTAGFLMEGLLDNNYDKVLDAWGQGALELGIELTEYADYIAAIYTLGNEMCEDFHGVFQYEVTADFGQWFGGNLLASKDIPTETESRDYLIQSALGFFTRGMENQNEADEFLAKLRMLEVVSSEHPELTQDKYAELVDKAWRYDQLSK